MGYGKPMVESPAVETPGPNPPPPRAMPPRFSLAQLLTAIVAVGAVLAAARMMITWRENDALEWCLVAAGFALTAIVLAVQQKMRAAELSVLAGIGFYIVWSFVLPEWESNRPRAGQWRQNLIVLAYALHAYHDEHGSFPPAVVRDAQGRPAHSWRALLLPYLELPQLHQQYRFDEPWDGPNNRLLHVYRAPRVFHCPDTLLPAGHPQAGDTSYVAIVGPGTMFPGSRGVKLDEIKDCLHHTIAIIEVHGSGIHWLEPRDLNAAKMRWPPDAGKGGGLGVSHDAGVHVALADSSVHTLPRSITREKLKALITIDGNEAPVTLLEDP